MRFEIDCPRRGCGTTVSVTQTGKLDTHKLPDGWRTCAASGATAEDAAIMPPPSVGPLGLKNE